MKFSFSEKPFNVTIVLKMERNEKEKECNSKLRKL